MGRKIYIGEWNARNPKIDLFSNGVYQYSTNYYTRCKDAKKAYEDRIDDAGQPRSGSSSRVTACISK